MEALKIILLHKFLLRLRQHRSLHLKLVKKQSNARKSKACIHILWIERKIKNTNGEGMFNKQWKNNFNAFWNSIFKEGQLLINSPFIMMPLRCLTLLNIGF